MPTAFLRNEFTSKWGNDIYCVLDGVRASKESHNNNYVWCSYVCTKNQWNWKVPQWISELIVLWREKAATRFKKNDAQKIRTRKSSDTKRKREATILTIKRMWQSAQTTERDACALYVLTFQESQIRISCHEWRTLSKCQNILSDVYLSRESILLWLWME